MKKFLFAAAAVIATAGPASAADFKLTYTATSGSPVAASIRISTANTVNSVGGYDILSAIGNVAGDAITGLVPNPNQPNQGNSPDGLFFIDNVYTPGAPVLTNAGILVTSAAGFEYNLYSVGATTYELYQAVPGVGYTGFSDGTLSVLAVPEPAQWALMLGGFGLMGGALRRRRSAASAVYA